jgi:hypothetical protein
MKIGDLKLTFESAIQPDPLQPIVGCAAAWAYFKDFLQLFPEGDENEEFGFSFSFANINDGITSRIESNLFQVYFGRLIDAEKNSEWRTAEINFYYRFEMNETLSELLALLPKEDVETAYYFKEGLSVIHKKQAKVVDFADSQQEIWKELKHLKPTLASYHFWVW